MRYNARTHNVSPPAQNRNISMDTFITRSIRKKKVPTRFNNGVSPSVIRAVASATTVTSSPDGDGDAFRPARRALLDITPSPTALGIEAVDLSNAPDLLDDR